MDEFNNNQMPKIVIKESKTQPVSGSKKVRIVGIIVIISKYNMRLFLYARNGMYIARDNLVISLAKQLLISF